MSLFGGFMRDFEEDPFFGPHINPMQHMNSMMNSMLADPFSMFGGFGGMGGMAGMAGIGGMNGMNAMNAITNRRPQRGGELMPFGFPNMNNIFDGFQMNANDPNCHSFSSSTVMTMSSGPDGRPQVYQASHSTRTAPGGVRETKKSVCDSRTGTKKLAIGHHIGERSHVMEREQNLHSGEEEERQEFINLEEEEAEDFNREWERKARVPVNAIGYGQGRSHSRRPRDEIPAILDRSRTRSRLIPRRHLPAITAPPSSSSEQTTERAKKRYHEEHVLSSDEEEETVKKSQKTLKSSNSKKH